METQPKIPLSVPCLSLSILENLKETIESGWVSTGGRFITEFERKFAQYLGVQRAISIQSGTAGLHMALTALSVGIGDEVIVPTLTFIATVNPVRYVGAEPIFMDCDHTLNMDLDKLEEFLHEECVFDGITVVNKRTGKTIKAIIIVHVFGNPIDLERLIKIKETFNIKIIEDAAEALGSKYSKGQYKEQFCGTIGDIGVYSFNANKIITTGGGGMVVSKSNELLRRIEFLSSQAKTDSLFFIHDEVGFNYRMTNINAAFGIDQMDWIELFIKKKTENYHYYKKNIKSIEGLKILPFNDFARANHWFYSLVVDEKKYGMGRNDLLEVFNSNQIQARPLWRLIHKQKPYLYAQSYRIQVANYYEDNLINIPCSSNLRISEMDTVVDMLKH